MPTRILEYPQVGRIGDGLPIYTKLLRKQAAMTATGTSAQSAAIGTGTQFITIQSDEQIYAEVSDNPTATTDSYRIPAGGQWDVEAAVGWKVAIRT